MIDDTSVPGNATIRTPAAVRLTPAFDAERLRAEFDMLTRDTWRRQQTYSVDGASEEYSADWRVLPLRSPGGDERRTDAGGPGPLPFRDTRWLGRTPYLAEIIASLPTGVRSARLMSLGVGAAVETHRDTPLGFAKGMVRLHVPITTNDNAVLVLDGETHRWQPGTFWYGDFSRPHSIANTGGSDRVHLVIDCAVSLRLFEVFPPDFLDTVDIADVLFERPEITLRRAERATFCCRFAMPAEFRHWSGEAFNERATDPTDVEFAVFDRPDGLVLTEGAAHEETALIHVGGGEFRLQGWTEERTLHLDRASKTVRFIIRDGSAQLWTERPIQSSGHVGSVAG
ncbi:aspartyl/asparaginyl beta-hydroxylase domain-containing protein [Streptomyces sp. NPDC020917]|uniref:aspartyl/asparaginyl beta-hydroxylase domain-containing protein n=1 Tax=Streptomyces sp. NPDC020917 TaxID=3365102 RepID=UPI0037B90885